MFVILLHYIKPASEVDRLVGEHRQFLARHYASGHFLLSGPQEPRTGGVILALAKDKAEVEAIIRQDPFHREGIAEYQIVEFIPKFTAAGLAQYKA
jgi:uncharacterized protein YciI